MEVVQGDFRRAREGVDLAKDALSRGIDGPFAPLHTRTRRRVLKRFDKIRQELDAGPAVVCVTQGEVVKRRPVPVVLDQLFPCVQRKNKKVVANTMPGSGFLLHLCPTHFDDSATVRAGTIVHELAHQAFQALDRATGASGVAKLTPAIARVNADTYGLFVTQLLAGQGGSGPAAPGAKVGDGGA